MCTVPLGLPVEPEEYSQKPGSSGVVGAGAARGVAAARAASNSTMPAGSSPAGCDTSTVASSCGAFSMALCSTGSSAPDTSAACARACSSM